MNAIWSIVHRLDDGLCVVQRSEDFAVMQESEVPEHGVSTKKYRLLVDGFDDADKALARARKALRYVTGSSERIEAFLADLSELTRKHGVAICGGCGYCDSPWLELGGTPGEFGMFSTSSYECDVGGSNVRFVKMNEKEAPISRAAVGEGKAEGGEG